MERCLTKQITMKMPKDWYAIIIIWKNYVNLNHEIFLRGESTGTVEYIEVDWYTRVY